MQEKQMCRFFLNTVYMLISDHGVEEFDSLIFLVIVVECYFLVNVVNNTDVRKYKRKLWWQMSIYRMVCLDWSVGEGDDERLLSINERLPRLRWFCACCACHSPASSQCCHALPVTGIFTPHRYVYWQQLKHISNYNNDHSETLRHFIT